jgi:hypothetical protein
MDVLISISNSLGSDIHVIELVDNGKPDPPKILVVKQMDYKTVSLKVRETSSVGIVNYKDVLRVLDSTHEFSLKTGWRKSTLSVIQRKNPTVKRKFTTVKL